MSGQNKEDGTVADESAQSNASDGHDHEDQPSGLSRRDLFRAGGVLGAAGVVAATTGVATAAPAAAADAPASTAIGGAAADTSRIELGATPIYDSPFPNPPTEVLPPLRDRVLALKDILVSKGVVDEGFINFYINANETLIGPRIGAAVVAHAWKNPAFKAKLINPPADRPFAATGLVSDFLQSQKLISVPPGSTLGAEGEWLRIVANGKDPITGKRVHNMVSCTACSCYPQALLGVQPVWYKSREYRSRSVLAPRGVMREFAEGDGAEALAHVNAYLANIDELRVWDSNSEARYLVIPEMPAAWAGLSEAELVPRISRNSMVGVTIL
jgi:nitrile hydratase